MEKDPPRRRWRWSCSVTVRVCWREGARMILFSGVRRQSSISGCSSNDVERGRGSDIAPVELDRNVRLCSRSTDPDRHARRAMCDGTTEWKTHRAGIALLMRLTRRASPRPCPGCGLKRTPRSIPEDRCRTSTPRTSRSILPLPRVRPLCPPDPSAPLPLPHPLITRTHPSRRATPRRTPIGRFFSVPIPRYAP